ncbi:MAG: 16S rRNA (cytosine(1402)-N(4))-methyltransferase [Erysipelotrichia bacterium]|nr:16S rRNA (cytosine(1402)-N(4))-methyltransferase [Erysipelotrichia bacterium]NCC54603.1 16S rRNA (cytosine(1402)-N(4))-methyltransferase [Erysipelotrichia bacterium]
MKKITEIALEMLQPSLKKGGVGVDFTLGNGNDLAFLARFELRKIYAFEIQKEVLEATKQRLQLKAEQVSFINDGHEHCLSYIRESIDVGIFNFGYCPKGDKSITTKLSTSKQAVESALRLLNVQGRLVLVLYLGHRQGNEEAQYFSEWVKHLDSHQYECTRFSIENRVNCPFILCIEKIR